MFIVDLRTVKNGILNQQNFVVGIEISLRGICTFENNILILDQKGNVIFYEIN
jgi:hypothetical protein